MPRETILPPLGTPPKGYSWEISRVQGRLGGRFGDKGYTYTIKVTQGKSVVIDTRFFIPMNEEGATERIIKENENRIRGLFS
ncbi:hypothetical protein HUN41_00226 [Streptomyces phage Coruscant]|uniref:Uncharacterized protein n=1 Tax=Streptomyces phage Coruscant TaxID=2739834 RepID=A0A7G4AWC7_9CAUD|nr:hypothetical protein PP454_gp100 [Streptomyces phage Coruscant]QMP84317.1 hypothetical protein HUN41_00226 [Streptomyces phage Coruscant]